MYHFYVQRRWGWVGVGMRRARMLTLAYMTEQTKTLRCTNIALGNLTGVNLVFLTGSTIRMTF